MKRVRLLNVCLATLVSPLLLVSALSTGFAQAGKHGKPFVDPRAPMPKQVTQVVRKATRAGEATAQTVDVTASTPLVRDLKPFWTRDERYVYFQSNRSDLGGTIPGSLFHVYRTLPSGGGAVAITGPLSTPAVGGTTNQTEPSISQGGGAMVYIDTTTAGAVDLVEMDLNSGTHATKSLTKNNPSGFKFVSLNHPEYGAWPGSTSAVLFAGQLEGSSNHLLFVVDVQTGKITQLTFGSQDDLNPTLSPDAAKPVIAFDSNRGQPDPSTRDVWVMGLRSNALAVQVAHLDVGDPRVPCDNREPAWSSTTRGQLLGFASDRVEPTAIGDIWTRTTTHDIYWLKTTIVPSAADSSLYTVTNTEPSGNVPFKLDTSDPKHLYDDRHPAWPQFSAIWRVAYSTDRTFFTAEVYPDGNYSGPAGQSEDIFASTIWDINAPTLLRYDTVTGEAVGVQPRLAAPESDVTFTVKVADFESGMPLGDPVYKDGVFLQLKNPNSRYQGTDGVEHKVFSFGGATPDGSNIVANVPFEYESQPINVNTYSYVAAPFYTPSDPRATNPLRSDYFAFTGSACPPRPEWLALKFVSRDPVTGVSTYSGSWKTDRFPTDYIIDVIAYDQAVNPFATGATDKAINWRIYDNVWGFTTREFRASKGILFVSDYACGQKFFGARTGVFGPGRTGFTREGTESWMTDINTALFPSQTAATTPLAVVNVLNALGTSSYSDSGTTAASQQYDIWRTNCRGPVPDAILQQYLPHTESQPADTTKAETGPRQVLVSNGCVIWHAPFSGDVFTGPGSLTDLQVQNQLHGYLQAGGRLLVNGQDIAWALTLDGAAANGFLSTDLKARYVGEIDIQSMNWQAPGVQFAGPPNPIGSDAFLGGATHNYPKTDRAYDPPNSGAVPMWPGPNPTAGLSTTRDYAAADAWFPDKIAVTGGSTEDGAYTGSATGTAMVHYADATTKSRMVYAAMGLEALNPEMTTAATGSTALMLKNRRTEILHNAVCWFRTGIVSGAVTTLEAGQPLANALVRLTLGNTSYTGITGSDGTFVISGIEPGAYGATAVKAGYSIQKNSGVTVHGANRSSVSIRMTLAEKATVRGKVTRTDGTTPVVGAVVVGTDVNDKSITYSATTGADGKYAIEKLPAFTTYTLTCSATGFGASIPVSLTLDDAADPTGSRLVQPAKTYEPYDFQLKALPVKLVAGTVIDPDGAAVAGATVTAKSGSTTVTAVTGADGAYSFAESNTPANALDPGDWGLVAVAGGFGANSPAVGITVATGETKTGVTIQLQRIPPGSVSGLVTRSSDNAALAGVTVTLKDSLGKVVGTKVTGDITSVDGYISNFVFTGVPAGVTYRVSAAKSGFTPVPAYIDVAVTSSVEAKGNNFKLDPLHTFSGSVSMVAAPYGYVGSDIADLLSVPAGDRANGTFLYGRWSGGKYELYPTAGSTTFELGKGYFMAYSKNLPLSTEGTVWDPSKVFSIELASGWNMIGNPFSVDVDWTKIKVVDGGVTKTYEQAVASGAIGSAVYTYVSGTYVLDFRMAAWRGYWVRAYRPVTLALDQTLAGISRAAAVSSRAVLRGKEGWALNLRANVGQVQDNDNFIGTASGATGGFDGFKVEKPPVYGDRYVSLGTAHQDWGAQSGLYGVDLRSASAGQTTWDVVVQTSGVDGTATVSWPNASALSRKVALTLIDVATGAKRDMRSNSSYTYQVSAGTSSRSFRIIGETATKAALRVSDIVGHQAGRSAGVTVSYNLSTSANVEVRIIGAGGGLVRTLGGRAGRAAGLNQSTWDLRSDRGVQVPAGSYLVEVKAIGADGSQPVRAIAPVTVVR